MKDSEGVVLVRSAARAFAWRGLFGLLVILSCVPARPAAADEVAVPILVYHRFGARVTDSMTVRTSTFASHLAFMRAAGYTVIPLRQLVACRRGHTACPTAPTVVLTADDAHRSVDTEMRPLVVEYRVPVTLFVYPSAVSRADYALTWDQLRSLRESGFFEIQSHTYWHPNFRNERKRLPPAEFERFVAWQLSRSRAVLEKELSAPVDLLSWPFGIFDPDLIARAREAGYVAAVTLERRHSTASDPLMALPRYLMTDTVRGEAFARLLSGGASGRTHVYE